MNLERSGFKVQQMLYDNSSGCLRYGKLVCPCYVLRVSSFIIGLCFPIQNRNANGIRVKFEESLPYQLGDVLW